MAKRFYDETDLNCFLIRDIRETHEPICCILKMVEIDDEENITLINLMTGFCEKTTKTEILKKYKKVTGENLQEIFKYVYTTHEMLSLDDKYIHQ